ASGKSLPAGRARPVVPEALRVVETVAPANGAVSPPFATLSNASLLRKGQNGGDVAEKQKWALQTTQPAASRVAGRTKRVKHKHTQRSSTTSLLPTTYLVNKSCRRVEVEFKRYALRK